MSALTSPKDENGLIGSCLIGGLESTSEALAAVSIGMILGDDARDTFAVLHAMQSGGLAITLETLAREWPKAMQRKPPFAFWSECMDCVPSAANLEFYVAGIRESHQRRQLSEMARDVSLAASDPSTPLDAVMGRVEAAMGISDGSSQRPQSSREVAREFVDDLQARMERRGQLTGVTTGFRRLDSMTEGMQAGDMWVIGARPSIGKTAIAVNMLEASCVNGGIPSMFISHEMNNRALMRRLVSSMTNIELGRLKSGDISESDQRRLMKEVGGRIKDSPVHWLHLGKGETVDVVCAQIRRASRKHGIRVVYLDYLQKVPGSKHHEKRTQEVGEVSSRLKSVADACGITLVALAQANRESEKDKPRPPKLSELGESSQIEKDADMVAMLHRERTQGVGDAALFVAKQRDGETGVVPLHYDGRFCRFSEPQREMPE